MNPDPPRPTIVLDTIILCLHINNQMKLKHEALYKHLHIPIVCKIFKKNHVENLVLPPSEPIFLFYYFCFGFFQNFVAAENEFFGLGIPENKFSSRAHAGRNYHSRQNLSATSPQSQMVAPKLPLSNL